MKMKKLISTLLSASMILSTAVFSVQAAATETTPIVPTNRGGGVMTDNGDGTYTFKSDSNVTSSSYNIPVTPDLAIDKDATDKKYVKVSFDLTTKTAGTANEIDLRHRNGEGNLTNTRNTYKPTFEGTQEFDVIVDLSNGTTYMYKDGVLAINPDTSLASQTVFNGLVIYSHMNVGSPTEFILSDVNYTVYSNEYTLEEVQRTVVPDEIVKAIVPITRNSTQGIVETNEDGTYTFTTVSGQSSSSFQLPISKSYTVAENKYAEKYVKISANINSVVAGIGRITINNGADKIKTFYKNLTGNQKLDYIIDLSNGDNYYYLDGVLVASDRVLSPETPLTSGLAFYSTGANAQFIISNATETVYSGAKTLDEITKAIILENTVEQKTTAIAPTVRGVASVEENSDGTYTVKSTSDTNIGSININATKNHSFSAEAIAEKYVKISADIKTVSAGTSNNKNNEFALNGGNLRTVSNITFAGEQKLDVVVDLSTADLYIYINGALNKKYNMKTDKKATEAEPTAFTGITLYLGIPSEYIFSNVTETVYSAANTLDEIIFDMIDDVMLEETSQKNNGVPGGLTNWSTENAYDSATDTITVTESVPLVGQIGRFTPLAASIKLGDQSGYAGLYHFTTYWTTTTQGDEAYYIINVGSVSVYNTQNVSVSLGNKYSSSPVVTGREYRVDVIIDANDPSAPKSYIYRDGILHKEAELAGTDLIGQSVYTSIRILDTADYEGKFRGTKATVYKKGVKTAEQIKTQIIDEISDSDIPVTIASPSISYADGKLVVKTEFVGAHADKTKYVAGYNSKNELVFALSPEAAAAGIALDKTAVSKVKVFAWDNFEPVAYMVDAKVEIED